MKTIRIKINTNIVAAFSTPRNTYEELEPLQAWKTITSNWHHSIGLTNVNWLESYEIIIPNYEGFALFENMVPLMFEKLHTLIKFTKGKAALASESFVWRKSSFCGLCRKFVVFSRILFTLLLFPAVSQVLIGRKYIKHKIADSQASCATYIM